MDEHLTSSPYQSLKPNRFYSDYQAFREGTLTPLLADTRVRVWHYTRLLDHEVNGMQQALRPSSLEFLRERLCVLVDRELLTQEEADAVLKASPFQTQSESRAGRMWTVTVPYHSTASGVLPLLESWGGESAYFWLREESLAAKLKCLGTPRILEIETSLSDSFNAFVVSETVLEAWAMSQGVEVIPYGSDLAITDSLNTAKIVQVHTKGESSYDEVGKTYPNGISEVSKEK